METAEEVHHPPDFSLELSLSRRAASQLADHKTCHSQTHMGERMLCRKQRIFSVIWPQTYTCVERLPKVASTLRSSIAGRYLLTF